MEHLQFKTASLKDMLHFLTLFMAPKFANLINLGLFDKNACEYFKTAIHSTIQHRQKQSSGSEKRNDFVQIMLEARSGQLKMEGVELDAFEKEAEVKNVKGKVELTDDLITGQCLIFFLAGFDTTQTLLQFATYQLAVCPDVQQKLVKEIIQTYEQNGNQFTYESINEMDYMDKVISETLRMYPPVPRLNRVCTTEYKIPGTDLVIPEGALINIPSYTIHHDPDIYPDPYRFDPERFTKEAKAERSPYAYMPFGHGPRNCIGMRFALTESKLALCHLLRTFVLEPSDKTCIPMKFAKESNFNLRPEGGHWIKLKPRV